MRNALICRKLRVENVQISPRIYSILTPILLKSPSDFTQKSVRTCDDWQLYCAPEVSQDIGKMAAKREIYSCRICPIAACIRQSMDWLMHSDALTAAQTRLPLVALVQACLLYNPTIVGVA